jgi:hypothetical protein
MFVVIPADSSERNRGKEVAEKKFRWDDILVASVKKKVWIDLHESWRLHTLASHVDRGLVFVLTNRTLHD